MSWEEETNLALILTKVLDWFYSIIETYNSTLNNRVWHKRWDKDKGTART